MNRTRSLLVVGVLLALLVVGPVSHASAGGLRARMFSIINRVRDRHGVRALRLNVDLSADARRHSRRMAERERIFHTANLRQKLRRYNWTTYGENIAQAGTLRRVKDFWMRSPPHRANLLNGEYRRAGVGVVRDGGWFWVTVIFYG